MLNAISPKQIPFEVARSGAVSWIPFRDPRVSDWHVTARILGGVNSMSRLQSMPVRPVAAVLTLLSRRSGALHRIGERSSRIRAAHPLEADRG